MVWGAFSYYGKAELAFTSSKMNSEEYIEVLDRHLIPFMNETHPQSPVFQQDNAPIHTSRRTKQWLAGKNVNVLDWPACSPDCNPMENLWRILVRKIYANGRQFESRDELKAAIILEWRRIRTNTLENLVKSMPNRIFEVIRRNGGVTDY